MKQFIAVGLGMLTTLQVFNAQADDRLGKEPPARQEERGAPSETLTPAQVEQVKAILSKYDPATLTADQAKAIHEAFRQVGIHGGPAMGEAVKAAGFDPDKLRDLAPPPDRKGGGDHPVPSATEQGPHGHGGYSMDQAISDRAQLSTIAFSGLAFITGDFGASTFMPPGKVCDFFGFQYMRDIDAAGKGHNPAFLNRVAGNVFHVLNEAQKKLFENLATEQAEPLRQLALKRIPLIKAFHRELDGQIPAGSAGLNREAVMRYVGDLFAYDAELSYRRAEVFGQVARSLSADQKAYLGKMKFGDFNTWPDLDEQEMLKRAGRGTSRLLNVAYMTYASEFFSWYAGSVEADTYFCPERHGTYFGGFFMKDMPAMGKRDFDISTSVTGDSGEGFLALLTIEQRANITIIIDRQRKSLTEIATVREGISSELRKFLEGESSDKSKVLALGRRYGELDGEMSWMYAKAFASVSRTLTGDQRAAMLKLRNLDAKYACKGAFLYSQPIEMPKMPDTDFLFNTASNTITASFLLGSTAGTNGGMMPVEYTGDGAGITPPLEWSGAPVGTKSYALIMHHLDPEGKTKWYWILYNIPADTKSLAKNGKEVGILGNNGINGRREYAPPHSKGPGAKTYVYTLYALSAPLHFDVAPAEVGRDQLLAKMEPCILGTAEMQLVYTRPDGAMDVGVRRPAGPSEPPAQFER